jgi:ATP synthase protein I
VVADDTRAIPLILLAQVGMCLAAGAFAWLWAGRTAGASALLGGAAAVVPNAFLAARLLTPRTARALLRAAWIGEIGKWLLTAVFFAAIFAFVRPVSAPAVFAGFIAVQLVVFGALFQGNKG